MNELTFEEKKLLHNMDQIHDVMQREIKMAQLFFKMYDRKPKSQQEVIDWFVSMVYGDDGEYMKIEIEHLKAGCFCSLGDCKEGEFYMDQIVVCTGGNLYHTKCFGPEYTIKKPEFEDMGLACSVCRKIFSRVSDDLYAMIWEHAKCPACKSAEIWKNHQNANS